jgi:hypothetical protein
MATDKSARDGAEHRATRGGGLIHLRLRRADASEGERTDDEKSFHCDDQTMEDPTIFSQISAPIENIPGASPAGRAGPGKRRFDR